MVLFRQLNQLITRALVVSLVAGCAGHASHTLEARTALDNQNPTRALELMNEQLGVSNAEALPANVKGDTTLFLLDRAMILQQLGRYGLSSRDLEVSDKSIEVLDFSRNAASDLGKYLFSDDAGPYKAPAYEKLLINTLNMVNYLARGDLNGARIEARRFSVMQKYLYDHEDPARSMLGPGSYLAGFTFEKSGKSDEALRYYDEALSYKQYVSLREPVQRLLKPGGFRSPRLAALAAETAAPASELDPVGELLVIVEFGRVPAKIAQRVPIGLALTYASSSLSPFDRARANRLATQGLVTWVNYPELGKPRGQYDHPSGFLDGREFPIEPALAIDTEAIHAWQGQRGAIIVSAITRMLSRVAVGEATNKVAGEGILGALLSLGAQAALTATDTPDTRSWATLPARLAFARIRVHPGTHTVKLEARGMRKTQKVTITPGGWAAVVLTALN